MPGRRELVAVWREGMGASLRSWGLLGRLTAGWVGALAPVPGGPRTLLGAGSGREGHPVPADEAGPEIEIEAESGGWGRAAFLVENRSELRVSAPVTLSRLIDPRGGHAHPRVAFRPEAIALEPGEQVVVQVVAAVDETLEPGVAYRGEIGVPELSGTRIPIVVRRRDGLGREPAEGETAGTPTA